MIRDDTVCHILVTNISSSDFACVRFCSGQLLDLGEEGKENVCVVVGIHILKDTHKTLHSHTSVNVLSREESQGTISLTIVLDKNVVPNLNDIGKVSVDKLGCVASSNSVVVDFLKGIKRS